MENNKLCGQKIILPMIICLLVITFIGCSKFWQRSPPTKEEYIQKFLPELAATNITAIHFTYQGGVGGFISAARVDISDTGYLEFIFKFPLESELHIKDGLNNPEKELLQSYFTTAVGKKLPAWLDLSSLRSVFIYKYYSKRYNRTFFIGNPPSQFFYMIVGGE
jgi:hypothetical protein